MGKERKPITSLPVVPFSVLLVEKATKEFRLQWQKNLPAWSLQQ
jgi:hypothetical protein